MSENEVEDAAFNAARVVLALVIVFAAATGAICKKHSNDQVPAKDAITLCAKTTSGEVERVSQCARDIVLPRIKAGELGASTYVPTKGMIKEVLAGQ